MLSDVLKEVAIYGAVLYCPVATIITFISYATVKAQKYKCALALVMAEAGCIMILLYTEYALPFWAFRYATPPSSGILTWPWLYIYVALAVSIGLKELIIANVAVKYVINIVTITANASVINFILVVPLHYLSGVQIDKIG